MICILGRQKGEKTKTRGCGRKVSGGWVEMLGASLRPGLGTNSVCFIVPPPPFRGMQEWCLGDICIGIIHVSFAIINADVRPGREPGMCFSAFSVSGHHRWEESATSGLAQGPSAPESDGIHLPSSLPSSLCKRKQKQPLGGRSQKKKCSCA